MYLTLGSGAQSFEEEDGAPDAHGQQYPTYSYYTAQHLM